MKTRTRHVGEDDLTLYYYGEGRGRHAIERHLDECARCAAVYREISGTLGMIAAPEAPDRGDQYGLEVWQRIRYRLPEPDASSGLSWIRNLTDRFGGLGDRLTWNALGIAAAAAVLVVAAFVAGRTWRTDRTAAPADATAASGAANGTSAAAAAGASDARRQILLASVADHLDRSERVLTDIMNAPPQGAREDISAEQRWAEDLLTTSRLYRQDAVDAGETSVASVLDDLERSLLEIVHSPSKIPAADLEQIRRRIDAAALLFKVRVLSGELRQREGAAPDRQTPRGSTSTSKIS